MFQKMTRRNFINKTISVPLATVLGASTFLNNSFAQTEKNGKKRLKLGCCAYSYRDYLKAGAGMTLDDFIDVCVGLELDGVELTSYYFPEKHTDEYLNHLKHKAFISGIEISGTAVGNNFCNVDGWVRHKQVNLVKTWIEKCAKLGAPCIRVFGGSRIPQGHTEEETHKWVVECLQECAEYGAKYGIVCALENHGGFPQSATQVIKVVKDVNSDWCKINLDAGNFRISPYEEIAQVAPYAANIHLKGEILTPEGNPVPADIPRIIKILQDANFKGYMSIEYESKEDAKTGVPKLVSQIKAAMV